MNNLNLEIRGHVRKLTRDVEHAIKEKKLSKREAIKEVVNSSDYVQFRLKTRSLIEWAKDKEPKIYNYALKGGNGMYNVNFFCVLKPEFAVYVILKELVQELLERRESKEKFEGKNFRHLKVNVWDEKEALQYSV